MMIRKYILSFIVALIIAILSLANGDRLNDIPIIHFPGLDKIVHFLMYFGLMSAILFENRKRPLNTRLLLLGGIISFIYGLLLELLQAWITVSRSGNIYDLLADLGGILFAVAAFLLLKHFGKEKIRY